MQGRRRIQKRRTHNNEENNTREKAANLEKSTKDLRKQGEI